MARRMWTVEYGDRCHVVELVHGHWSGKRRIRVDDEMVHESQVVFDLGRTRHGFEVDGARLALVVSTNGATYGYGLAVDDPARARSTELAPARAGEGSGDEPVPVLAGEKRTPAEGRGGSEPQLASQGLAASLPPPAVLIHRLAGDGGAHPQPHAGALFNSTFGVLTLALGASLVGASLGFLDLGAVVSGLVVGAAGVLVGRRRGEIAGAETLFSLLGGLLGAGLGFGLGAGLFGLLLVAALALMLLAPLPEALTD